MRKNVSTLLGVVILLFAGCKTADDQIPQIATDFCNCFTDMEKNMSSKTKDIMEKAGNAADPTAAMAKEMEKLTDEEKQTVGTEMSSFSEMDDKNSKVGLCMADVEKKYDKAKTFNETKFLQKLVKELESKTGCSFTATLLKIGLKAKEGGK